MLNQVHKFLCAPPSSFHNKLKYNPRYLGHKVNYPTPNDLTHVLLKVEHDLFCHKKMEEVEYIHTFSLTLSQTYTMQVMKTAAHALELQEGDRDKRGYFLTMLQFRSIKLLHPDLIPLFTSGKTPSSVHNPFKPVFILNHCHCKNVQLYTTVCHTQCVNHCRHWITCTCLDYQSSHLYKHCYKTNTMIHTLCTDRGEQLMDRNKKGWFQLRLKLDLRLPSQPAWSIEVEKIMILYYTRLWF